MKRYLLCCGDANNPTTHGGLSFFLLQAGVASGLLQGGLALDPQRLRCYRRLWNVAQLLRTGRAGGFQYSSIFRQLMMAQAGLPQDEPVALLSHFPMLPCYPWPDCWEVGFYIDATTSQVFYDYFKGIRIAKGFRERVLRHERLSYQNSRAVICRSQWAAKSLTSDYGIDSSKVQVVPGGANLDESQLALLSKPDAPYPPASDRPLRLGFLGKEWRRKGGPFLLRLADSLIYRGIPTVIRTIGPSPNKLPRHPALQPLGFINKLSEMPRFVSEVKSWHFGTLFSEAEAFGISSRECLRLGVPMLAHSIGGIPSTMTSDGCGQLFEPHPSPKDVADCVAGLIEPYSDYLSLRAALSRRWKEFTWATAAEKLATILNK